MTSALLTDVLYAGRYVIYYLQAKTDATSFETRLPFSRRQTTRKHNTQTRFLPRCMERGLAMNILSVRLPSVCPSVCLSV